jgi:phosphotransacetylase
VLDARVGRRVIGVSLVLIRGRAVLVADVSVTDMPDGERLADITDEAVRVARRLAIEPRVALLAYSTFGIRAASAPTRCARRCHPRQAPGRFRVRRRHGGRLSP